MVDCPYYNKQTTTPQQERLKSWLDKFPKKQNGDIYFPLYINGKLIEGSDLIIGSIDDFLEPTYCAYELVRLLLKMKLETSGGSSAFASESSHYSNLLILLAYMMDCVSNQDELTWEQKFNAKYNK